jgi:hypothetical protein
MPSREFRQKSTNKSVLTFVEPPPEVKRAAARRVASAARDVADCALLLNYLGLTPEDGGADITRALGRGM